MMLGQNRSNTQKKLEMVVAFREGNLEAAAAYSLLYLLNFLSYISMKYLY